MINCQKILYTVLFLSICSFAIGQNAISLEQQEMTKLTNPWLHSKNAAGLAASTYSRSGYTELGYKYSQGDLHRAQEGNRLNGLNFFSERYDTITNKWKVWGSFEFNMYSEHNRAWSDVINTYNAAPYIFGDSVKGKYDVQRFDLNAKISRYINDRFSMGLSLNFTAEDMSRQRDARTRTYVANYSAIPGIIYMINKKNTIGLHTGIGFEKEKMPSVTTVQQSPKIDYYFFYGNENATSVLNGYTGFNREFVKLSSISGIQHQLSTSRVKWFNDLGFAYGNEHIYQDEHASPGNFRTYTYSLNSAGSIKINKNLLNIRLNGMYNLGKANEYLQEKVILRDSTTGNTSTIYNTLYEYKNRYVTHSYSSDLNISMRNFLEDGKDYSWVANVEAQVNGFKNEYYLPYSVFESNRMRIGAGGGYRIYNKNAHKVTFHAALGYSYSLSDKLQLNEIASGTTVVSENFEKGTTRIASEVLTPDHDYYKQNVLDYRMDISYSFPVKFKKSTYNGFGKLYFGGNDSQSRGSRTILGGSIGIIVL